MTVSAGAGVCKLDGNCDSAKARRIGPPTSAGVGLGLTLCRTLLPLSCALPLSRDQHIEKGSAPPVLMHPHNSSCGPGHSGWRAALTQNRDCERA